MSVSKQLEKIFHRKEREYRIKRYTYGALDCIRERYREEKDDDIRRSIDLNGVSDPISSSNLKCQKKSSVPHTADDEGEIRFSLDDDIAYNDSTKIKYSTRDRNGDKYDPIAVGRAMKSSGVISTEALLAALENSIDRSFVDRLVYYINEKGLKDSDVYKAAQIDKRLFSKITSNAAYKPSKDTVIALAFGLSLTLDEATDLMKRAGYTFSHSSKRDVIIEYFFREGIHDIIDANEVLYRLGEKLIGRF